MMDKFTRAYVEAILFSSNDDEGTPLDENYTVDDFAPESVEKIVADCKKFQEDAADWISDDHRALVNLQYTAEELAGQDFWLTRAGHGSGFWDGDWTDEASDELCDATNDYESLEPYVGDDGKIYFFSG